MVLKVLAAAVNAVLPSKYYVHAFISILVIVVVRAFARGRTTNRERDMHARVVLLTGGFTPLGLTLMQNLAQRGAHIIALSPKPVQDPEVEILINLLRSTTKNDQIFADECDLTSASSVRSFCSRFLTAKETRLDGIVFAHEYQQLGSIIGRQDSAILTQERQNASLASFLILTLLLPILLVAPAERDIRIINVVNPFYAAAAPSFSPTSKPPPSSPVFHQEGWRSLQMIVFTRHLQRVLDALPSGGQVPKTDDSTIHVVSDKVQKSNIVAVSVCPGLSRSDTIAPLLNAVRGRNQSIFGIVLYMLLQPFLRLLAKSTTSAIQSVLHVLFLPTPFKSNARQGTDAPEEVLKAGALYRECAVVNLRIQSPVTADAADAQVPDDGELGGVHLGQAVWEGLEDALKEWEKVNPQGDEKVGCDDGLSVDTQGS
ncbi:uncharacterized protein HD556DRAFT_1371433 [Suillus plorans]|uniref:Ketoreductase (KR) domain-containing protein n=1 Tax=Suillus plorans TaxID=116603 RepID=A0A9P7DIE3_9AGAM|nr:uncharacterized protein HD556DRAFT_1371433 [Suillus plorans]KAG1794176.1 hypothetical protein HD556DRAFT_1371433 [Suillus plorans]